MTRGRSVIRWWLGGLALVLLLYSCGGGGGGGSGREPRPAPSLARTLPRVSLAADRAAGRVGDPVVLSWTAADVGALTAPTLYLAATEPGQEPVTAGRAAARVNVGSPVAEARTFYRTAAGDWTETPTAYGEAASGAASVSLPAAVEGLWRFEVRLTEGGEVRARASREVLAADLPRIALRLSRSLANGDDPVRVEVVTAAGVTPGPVKVAALLTRPDGSQASLPDLRGGLHFAYEGDAVDERRVLWDRPLAGEGTGQYRLRVDLLDGATGASLALAEADFQVCDTPASVTGVVRAADGAPLDGVAAASSWVRALDVDDAAVAGAAQVGADGGYTLELPPGRYLLRAEVADGAGVHQAVSTGLVSVGCTGSAASLDLTAGVPVAGRAAARRPAPRAASRPAARRAAQAAAAACVPEPLPWPAVVLEKNFDSVPAGLRAEAQQLYADFQGFVRVAHARFLNEDDITDLLSYASLSLADQAQIDDMVSGTHFALVFAAAGNDPEGIDQVAAVLLDLENLDPLRSHAHAFDATTDARRLTDEAFDAALAISQDPAWAPGGEPLADLLWRHLERPLVPKLFIDAPPDPYQPTDTVNVTVTLTDLDCSPMEGKTVVLRKGFASTPHVLDDFTGVTDAAGTVTWPLPVGGLPGQPEGDVGMLFAHHERADGSAAGFASHRFRVVGQADLRLTGDDAELAAGATGQACAQLRQAGSPVAGATLQLTARNATLWNGATSGTQTTDAQGEACFDFAAGALRGLAEIEAAYAVTATVTERGTHRVLVGGPVNLVLSATPTTLPNDGASVLTAVADLGATDPAGVFVAFSQSGLGTVVPGSGFTDAGGVYRTRFVAPHSGHGTTTVTASIWVEGQRYDRDVELRWGSAGSVEVSVFAAASEHMGARVETEWGAETNFHSQDVLNNEFTRDRDGPSVWRQPLFVCDGTGGDSGGSYTARVTNARGNAADAGASTTFDSLGGTAGITFRAGAAANPETNTYGNRYGLATANSYPVLVVYRVINRTTGFVNLEVSWNLSGASHADATVPDPDGNGRFDRITAHAEASLSYWMTEECSQPGDFHDESRNRQGETGELGRYWTAGATPYPPVGTRVIAVPPGGWAVSFHASASAEAWVELLSQPGGPPPGNGSTEVTGTVSIRLVP